MPSAGDFVRASDVGGDVGCRIRRVANQSVNSATDTAISWDTEDQDTDGFIVVTATTITIPTGLDGLYALTFRAQGAIGAGRAYGRFVVTSAITGTPTDFLSVLSDVEDQVYVAIVLPLNAADTFTCNVRHTSGVAVNFVAWLACYRIAAF